MIIFKGLIRFKNLNFVNHRMNFTVENQRLFIRNIKTHLKVLEYNEVKNVIKL